MNFYKVTSLFIFIVLIAHSLYTASYEVDIEKALSMAVENDINLKIKDIELRLKKSIRDSSWNVLLPGISTSATLYHMNEAPQIFSGLDMATMEPAFEQGEQWGMSVGLNAQLYLNAALFQGFQYNVKEYRAGLINKEVYEKRLRRNVKKSFYNLIILKESVNLFQYSLETANKWFNQAKLNYEAGVASEFDLLSAQVSYENLKPGFKEIRNAYNVSELTFKQILGLTSEDEITLIGDINVKTVELDTHKLISSYMNNNLDLQLLHMSQKSLQTLKTGFMIQSYTPSVFIMFSMDPTFRNNPFENNLFDDMENDWSQVSGMFSISLSFNLGAFIPGSKTHMQIRELTDQIAALKLQTTQARNGIELNIKTIVMNIEKSKETLDILSLNMDMARRAFQIADQGYKEGVRELIEVENVEDDLRKAKLEVLKEKYNYISNLLDLEYILNINMDENGKEIHEGQ